MNNEWDGRKNRRKTDTELGAMEDRVRMLEEKDRAGEKSREGMHRQIETMGSDLKTGFNEVAEAINDLGMELLASKKICPNGEGECPKADMPWVKDWLRYIGYGEVALACFMVSWMLTH
jgi:hypothetical protein